jgi:hypothetical protein
MAEVQGVSELALIATTFPLITLDEITAEGGSRVFEQMCENLKANGYSGLDISVQQILALGKLTFAGILERTGLKFIAKCYSSGGGCPTGIAACIANASITHPPQGVRRAGSRDCNLHRIEAISDHDFWPVRPRLFH